MNARKTQRTEVVRLDDWRDERRDESSRTARLKREAEARRRAEVVYERSRMPWWKRLALGFVDLFR